MTDQEKNKKESAEDTIADTRSGPGLRSGIWILVLHAALLLYACTSLCSKNAVRYPAMSMKYLLFYALMIGILGLYAIVWQQVIKHLPVTFAYANKAVTVVWGVVLGRVFFGERITILQLAACAIIIAGTVLYVTWAKEE